jgi:hypothetical protein
MRSPLHREHNQLTAIDAPLSRHTDAHQALPSSE